MDTTGLDMTRIIRDLAFVDRAGAVEEMVLAYSGECRGTPRDSAQLISACDLFQVKQVARVLLALFEIPLEQGEAMARSVLLPHPRRDTAIALIHEYAVRQATEQKLTREREKQAS